MTIAPPLRSAEPPLGDAELDVAAADSAAALPVLIRIPDLDQPPEEELDEGFAAAEVVPAPPRREAPAAPAKPALKQTLDLQIPGRVPPRIVVVGALVLAALLGAMLLGGGDAPATPEPKAKAKPKTEQIVESPSAASVEKHMSAEPVKQAASPAPVDQPQKTSAEANPDVMPWPRPQTQISPAEGPALSAPSAAPQAGIQRQPFYEARRPSGPAAQFEGTITKPAYGIHHERY